MYDVIRTMIAEISKSSIPKNKLKISDVILEVRGLTGLNVKMLALI